MMWEKAKLVLLAVLLMLGGAAAGYFVGKIDGAYFIVKKLETDIKASFSKEEADYIFRTLLENARKN